jgi:hypothetical protein
MNMSKILNGAVIVLGLAGATLALSGPANAARVGISLNLGNIAFGYQDGYWDHSHHWHKWRNQSDAQRYQASSGNQYHDWNHTRDADHGWHN